MLSRIFLSISATVEMNTDLDPVGTAVPGEIPGEIAAIRRRRKKIWRLFSSAVLKCRG